jgi:predicted phage terminase large subunit-like protein
MTSSLAARPSLAKIPPLAVIEAEIARRARERERIDVENNAAAIRARCQTFAGFVREAWHVLEPNSTYIHSWHINAICSHLEAVTDGRITRLLINVPPGSMKSLLVSVLWQAWEWGPKGMRSMRYLSTSFNDVPVKRDVRKSRDLMLSEWYRGLWPDVIMTRTGETSFANASTGTREGVAFGSLTSQRGDRLLIDDPHSTETAESETERATTTRRFREGAVNRLNDQARSAIVVIMQRLHSEDVSGIIKKYGMEFVTLCLPMEFETASACSTVIGFSDPRTHEGELLDPVRFPRETVEKLKRDMGSYAFSGQYQQRPAPRDGGYFQSEWLIPVDAMPPRDSLRIYGGSDYAVTSNGGDYTVHAVLGLDVDGNPWLLDLWRKQAASDEWVVALCDLVKKWKPMAWAEESGQIKSGVGPFLEREMRARKAYTAREQFPTKGDKAVRAQSFRGLIATCGLRIPALVPWRSDFESELMNFPAGVHDDAVDACGLIGQLLDKMISGPSQIKPEVNARDDYRETRSVERDEALDPLTI